MKRIVVTGTGTDIGKTVFAAALTLATGGCYWKPVQAGTEGGGDAREVERLGVPPTRVLPEGYRLTTACSPHEAAAIDGVAIDPDLLTPPDCDATLVIEGAGGLLVPLASGLLAIDLFARWHEPVVLVATTALGTINHSLLSIEALRARGLDLIGVAFVGATNPASEQAVCEFGNVRALGRLPRLDPLTPGALRAAFAANFAVADFT